MKAYIGPYLNWWGPYQIMEALLKPFGVSEERAYDYGERLSNLPYLSDLCEWIYEHRRRKIKVHIDRYDIWSMDTTLAYIILPMLKLMQEKKMGSPLIGNQDVPKSLWRDESLDIFENDPHYHERWDWVIGEMIFAFEHILKEEDSEDFLNKELQERVDRGLRLFGKYFRALWD